MYTRVTRSVGIVTLARSSILETNAVKLSCSGRWECFVEGDGQTSMGISCTRRMHVFTYRNANTIYMKYIGCCLQYGVSLWNLISVCITIEPET